MPKPIIKPVSGNKDKQNTYKQLTGKYNKAMRYEFYFEAMMIVYAFMEDRLRSALYYVGVFSDRNQFKAGSGKTQGKIRKIVSEYGDSNGKGELNVKAITGKIKIMRAILKWASENECDTDDKYLKTLKSQCEGMDIGGVLETFDNIEKWCDYRNEVIHASLNKNIDSLYGDLKDKVSDGMEYARFLDNEFKALKKGNRIRIAAKLKVER